MKTNYDNFVFYGAIREAVDSLPEDVGNRLLRAVMNYGTAGEMPDPRDAVVYAVMSGYMPNIQNAKNRYSASKANGSTGGRPKTYSDADIAECLSRGISIKEIAERFGCSTKTVQRVKNKLEDDDNDDIDI